VGWSKRQREKEEEKEQENLWRKKECAFLVGEVNLWQILLTNNLSFFPLDIAFSHMAT